MPKRTLSIEQEQEIVERYRSGEKSAVALAKDFAVSSVTIHKTLRRLGVETRRRILSPEEEAEFVNVCVATGTTVGARAAFDIPERTAFAILKRHGVSLPKGPALKLTPEDQRQIITRRENGEAVLAIARDFPHVHVQTLHNVIERWTAKNVPPTPDTPRKGYIVLPEAARVLFIDECANGTPVPHAVKRFNISESTGFRILRAAGVSLPKGRPRAYEVDDTAFDALTPENLYWQGFIFADGCVNHDGFGSPKLIIGLAVKDEEHLVLFQRFLKSTHPIRWTDKTATSKGGPFVYYSVRSKQIAAALESRGIITKRLRTPTVDLAQSPEFWRGTVDGDGWLGTQNFDSGYACPYIGLSGQYPLLTSWQKFLFDRIGLHVEITRTTSGIWKTQTAGKGADRIITLLYKDALVALTRKNARAQAIILGDLRKFPPYIEEPSATPIEGE